MNPNKQVYALVKEIRPSKATDMGEVGAEWNHVWVTYSKIVIEDGKVKPKPALAIDRFLIKLRDCAGVFHPITDQEKKSILLLDL